MAATTSFLSLLQPLATPEARREEILAAAPTAEEATAAVAEAFAEAEEIRRQARREAEEILEDARVQAESFREAAWQEGFHSGEDVARAQVAAELQAAWETEREELHAQAKTLVESIGAARQALWEAQEIEMVGLALDIARQVIKTEVTQNPVVVTEVLHNALRRVVDKEHVRVRISVPDAPLVRGQREDLISLLDGIKNLEIVDDRRIGQGGCVIETNAGTIDAKIETQLAEVERALGLTDDE